MKTAVYFVLLLAVGVAEAQAIPRGSNWSQELPKLVESYSVLFLGERHGNLSNYETYEPLLKNDRIDTFFLEWVYDHKQDLLDAYFADDEAVPRSLKETYHLCLLVRGSSFDRGTNTKPISFAKFKKLFSDVPSEKMLAGCDHEGSAEFLRKLYVLKRQRPDVKICAIDYWDYYPENSEIPEARIKTFSEDLKHIGNVFYDDYRSQVRELALAQNILKCVDGRKHAVGILGAFHLNPLGAAGIVETSLGVNARVGKIVQITSSVSGENLLCKKEDECDFADEAIQKRIQNETLKFVEVVPAREFVSLLSAGKEAEFKKFWEFQNYVIIQPARPFFGHDGTMFYEIRSRMSEAAP